MKILGIDPGLSNLAFAFLEVENNSYKLKDWQTFNTKHLKTLPDKLAHLFNKLKEKIEYIRPDIIAVEKVFNKNHSESGNKLIQAQGIVLLIAGLYNMPVEFYHPLEVKEFISQYGKAKKREMRDILKLLFKEKIIESYTDLKLDSHKIDALAIALVSAFKLKS